MRLGFDVGGTKTDAVIVAPSGEIVARVRRTTGWGADGVVATIVQVADELVALAGASRADITSIGVGMPGQVAPGTARVAHAVNLGIAELDVAAALRSAFRAPVRAENDVKAAALGAFALHGAPGPQGVAAAQEPPGAYGADPGGSMAYLNLGTGVAAGFVKDGVLWRGERGTAGEVGHISIDPAGPLCRCGQRGCIEAFCGGASVARQWGLPADLPVRDVFDAADAGDPRAAGLRRGLAFGVAAAVRVLVLTADVGTVVLGGGLTGLGDRMLGPVVSELEASAAASAFLRSLRLAERVDLLPPGSPAAALGASLIGAAAQEQEAVAHG
jgi:predicted NBD/HSP70 family sugar kinase